MIENEPTMNSKPTTRNPTQGRTIAVVGDVYRFLATGEDTNGQYALWEALVPPGGGPPPHVHSREEEGFYVLEGEILSLIHISEPTRLLSISYAVFCLKKKKIK